MIIDYRFEPNSSIEQAVAASAVDIGLMSTVSLLEDVSCQPISKEALLLVTQAGYSVSQASAHSNQ